MQLQEVPNGSHSKYVGRILRPRSFAAPCRSILVQIVRKGDVYSGGDAIAHGPNCPTERDVRRRTERVGRQARSDRSPRIPRYLLSLSLSYCAAFAGGAAKANCPVAGDLSGGIRLDYADGYSIVTRDESGAVIEEEHLGDDVFVYKTDNGLIETEYVDVAGESTDHYSYTFDTFDIEPPKPWSGRHGEQITRNESGEEVERVPFSYHTRAMQNFKIGPCDFEAIAYQTYLKFPDGTSMVELMYLVELGIPIVVGFKNDGYFDPYRPTAISAVRN